MTKYFRSFSLLIAVISIVLAIGDANASSLLDTVKQRGELKVCIWGNYFAISFRDQRTGALSGVDIDMSQALADDLGVKRTLVDSSFADFMDNLEQGACDIAMFGVGMTEARAKRVAFSNPYLASGIYGVTTKTHRRIKTWNDIDQPGVVVAVQKGTFMEPVMASSLHNAELLVVAPPMVRETELEAGRADVFMADFPYTRRMLYQFDWAAVIEPAEPLAVTRYAYAVKQGDQAWLDRVNQFVAAVKADGRLRAAAGRYDLTRIVIAE